jgi:hypothetical protein
MRLFATGGWRKFFAVEVLIIAGIAALWLIMRTWFWVPNYYTDWKVERSRDELTACIKEIGRVEAKLKTLDETYVTLPKGFTEKRIRAIFNPSHRLGAPPPFEMWPRLYQGPNPEISLTRDELYVLLVEFNQRGWTLPSDLELPAYLNRYVPFLYEGWQAADMVRDVKEGMQQVWSVHRTIEDWDKKMAETRRATQAELDELGVKRGELAHHLLSTRVTKINEDSAEEFANKAGGILMLLFYPVRASLALLFWALRTVRRGS